MQQTYLVSTEGVFIMTSSKGLAQYYADKNFDYAYPEGLFDLIRAGIATVITTESGDELNVLITDEPTIELDGFESIGTYPFQVLTEDAVFFLNHAEFTQICDNNRGDIQTFDFWEAPQQIDPFPEGVYELDFYFKEIDLEEEEEEENPEYELELLIHVRPQNGSIASKTIENILRF